MNAKRNKIVLQDLSTTYRYFIYNKYEELLVLITELFGGRYIIYLKSMRDPRRLFYSL
jgi:hypothetical protein